VVFIIKYYRLKALAFIIKLFTFKVFINRVYINSILIKSRLRRDYRINIAVDNNDIFLIEAISTGLIL
jgi:hypothetical protein